MKKSIGILAIAMIAIVSTQALAKDAAGKLSAIGLLGYYMPADSAVDDLYGGGVTFGGGVNYDYSPQISIVGALSYWKDSKTVVVGNPTNTTTDNSLRIMPITCNVIYHIPCQSFPCAPYIGGGIGYYSAESKTNSVSKSKGAVGFQVLGGCTYPVSPNLSITALAEYASAKVDFVSGKDTKIGGLTIGGGVVYSF